MKPNRKMLTFSILAALSLLFSFAAAPQPALAAGDPPTVNGLFYGDGDSAKYGAPFAISSVGGARLYKVIDGQTLYVALVVDGRYNDNVFDSSTSTPAYMQSAAWTQSRNLVTLTNSEYAAFEAVLCGTTYTWQQGYARPIDNSNPRFADNTTTIWASNATLTPGLGTPPPGYDSSSSIVWNLNNWREKNALGTPPYNMNVNCGVGVCPAESWKSPFDASNPDSVTILEGYPPTFTTGTPITYDSIHQWEWAMVYEWSVTLPAGCTSTGITIASNEAHHSPYKAGAPTAVKLASVAAQSGAQMPMLTLALALGITVATAGVLRKGKKQS